MRERQWPTLADAQRQVWVRGIIGGLLIILSIISLLLFLVKHVYVNLSYSPFSAAWGGKLRSFIDALLGDWAVLNLLWRVSPPWQPMPTLPTTLYGDFFWAILFATVVGAVGGLLLRSARARHAQIKEFRQEIEREIWREQARGTRRLAPVGRGSPTVIGQVTWHQYPAPPESFGQTALGSVILGIAIGLVAGLIVAFIQLYAEYEYFQPRWPASRY